MLELGDNVSLNEEARRGRGSGGYFELSEDRDNTLVIFASSLSPRLWHLECNWCFVNVELMSGGTGPLLTR